MTYGRKASSYHPLRGPFQFQRVRLPSRFADEIIWGSSWKQVLCHDLVDVMPVVAKHSFQ